MAMPRVAVFFDEEEGRFRVEVGRERDEGWEEKRKGMLREWRRTRRAMYMGP